MAKGDTKTNQYLDVAANGTRADLPSDTCCETRTQALIRGVAERVMDVEDEVEEIKNNPDVVDIVDTYADLLSYPTSGLTNKDVIRVIADEEHDGLSSYYRWNSPNPGWNFVGVIPGGDGIKELSSADYNYPTENPDRVALWLLDNGVYTAPAGVMVAASTTSYPWYNTSDKTILVGGSDTVKGIYTFLNGKTDVVTTQVSDGTEADEYTLFKSNQVLQATGQSATDTMSQKAITDALNALPTVNDATLTITQNGTSKGTFTANDADDTTIALTDTTYNVFTGTDGTSAGTAGLVPAPATTDAGKFLKADGTWDSAGGGITELTSADYNWPTSGTATAINPALLSDGLYETKTKLQFIVGNTATGILGGYNIVAVHAQDNVKKVVFYPNGKRSSSNDNNPFDGMIYTLSSDGSSTNNSMKILYGSSITQSTGTSTTDVMSQNAVTSMIYADPSTKRKIQIGSNANASGPSSVAIGGLNTAASGVGSIVLGPQARATAQASVAFAYGAATTQGEFNIGTGDNWTTGGYNNSAYRLLTGLHAGVNAHDAVNKGQLDTAIINGGTTAPTTATVGAVGTLYSYVDTTGTPAPHMMVCTEIDTTDPSNPVYTWQTLV